MTMMSFNKSRVEKILQRNEVLFCSKLNPIELLPYLPCMSEMSKEEISCEQRNFGAKRAASILLKQIRRQDKCLIDFIRALRYSDMPHEDLADMLDPDQFICDTGQHMESSNSVSKSNGYCSSCISDTNLPASRSYREYNEETRVPVTRSQGEFDSKTPIRQLPCRVMDILQSKLDYDDKWKELAAFREYTIEEVQRLQSTGKSCASQIITEWYGATVEDLFKALHAIQRFDILTDIENQIGYKSILNTEEPFIDLKLKHELRGGVIRQVSDEDIVSDSIDEIAQEVNNEESAPIMEQNETIDTNPELTTGDLDQGRESVVFGCVLNQRDSKQLIPEVGDHGISVRPEIVSIENNSLQDLNNQNSSTESDFQDSDIPKKKLKEDEDHASLNEKNVNTKHRDKNLKNKEIPIANKSDDWLIVGAAGCVIGAVALGFLALKTVR